MANIGTYRQFTGLEDEVRISNIARSSAWLKATYYTLKDNLLAFSTSSGGGGGGSGWANRVQITIDHTKITSDLTQFPVLIKISSSSGTSATNLTAIFTALGSNSKKIAVTQADGTTQLNVEVEKWDNANQQAWLWVSKPGWSISSTQDTTLYLYYDNTHADNTDYVGDTNSTPARAVWDANYKAVYHLNDGADTSHIYDSTSNTNNGTKKAANEPIQVDGLSAKAQQFDGTNDYIDTGAGTASITGDLTLEAFFKPTTSSASEARALIDTRQSRNDYTLPYELALESGDNEPYIRFGTGSSGVLIEASTLAPVNEFSYFYGSISGTAISCGLNAGTPYTGTFSGTRQTGTNVTLGMANIGTYRQFTGLEDEVRISNIARSSAWLKATYYTLKDNLVSFSSPSSNPSNPSGTLQDVKYTWDAGGNLSNRQDLVSSETETFSYDFLDRLTGVSGPYTESYGYNQIGNLTSKNGASYTYGDSSHKHAVTQVGTINYTYDANGNMLSGDGRTIVCDAENRPVSVTKAGVTTTFVYDGDGNRVKQTVGSTVTTYVNKYYEKTGTVVTTNYYLGGKLIATRKAEVLNYVHQDNLGSTSATSDNTGTLTSTIKYFPYGVSRNSIGTLPTDKLFTGQRLDTTGLYYYGARYYDPGIGRFISPDTIVSDPANPQSLNRYSYALNNPLKYSDPTGHWPSWSDIGSFLGAVAETVVSTVASSFMPYIAYTQVYEPICQLVSGQKSIQDFQSTPAQTIENIKNYYDVTNPTGLGHLAGTVAIAAGTAFAGAAGAAGSTEVTTVSTARSTASSLENGLAGSYPKPLGIGISKGAFNTPTNISEEMAFRQVASNPADGFPLNLGKIDPRWPPSAGWSKMGQNAGNYEMHYQYNNITKAFDDLKIKRDFIQGVNLSK